MFRFRYLSGIGFFATEWAVYPKTSGDMDETLIYSWHDVGSLKTLLSKNRIYEKERARPGMVYFDLPF